MEELEHSFSLQRFINDVFRYYRLGLEQPHPNEWVILLTFDKFLELVGKEPITNLFKVYYQLIKSTCDGSDI